MIKVGKEYIIDTDERNYILYSLTVAQKGKHTGETRRTVEGYFQTLEQALRAIVDRNTINGLEGVETAQNAVKRVEEIHAHTLAEIKAALHEA